MRSDYGLYVVALICFIIAGAFLASVVPGYTPDIASGQMVIAIFAILGIIFAVAGYALRPKVVVPTPAPPPAPEPSFPPPLRVTEKKVEEAPVAPPPAEEEAPAAPSPPPTPITPTHAPEEPAKVETAEEKPQEKRVRRRRRKKTE